MLGKETPAMEQRGSTFVEQVKAMEIEQVLSAPRAPCYRAHIERVIWQHSPGVLGSK
jgi:hypothetical protein